MSGNMEAVAIYIMLRVYFFAGEEKTVAFLTHSEKGYVSFGTTILIASPTYARLTSPVSLASH